MSQILQHSSVKIRLLFPKKYVHIVFPIGTTKELFYNSKNFCIHRYHCKKTYASAFAMRELGFQRALFLVHRNKIAKQAKKSFRKVFSGQVSMGLVTGKYQEYDKDFIFVTIQTLSKEENLHRYEKNAFDAS